MYKIAFIVEKCIIFYIRNGCNKLSNGFSFRYKVHDIETNRKPKKEKNPTKNQSANEMNA